MANTKSAIKNIRKNQARYLQNRMVTSRLKTLEKKFLSAIESKDSALAKAASSSFISALEKAKKSSLVHSNKVSRKKSRCSLLLSSIAS
ncbi:MAG: 30S ribosomal protein S20 [Opitutae bacterium]|nr:30S ribosomal protein S20 [Opitutae bacterium]